ncbi:MAG TPA: hypothetical protein VFT75_16360 [Nocardioidaceae bacterium]|nr:hypothetical protein [Nocardioidaceae bacterium]
MQLQSGWDSHRAQPTTPIAAMAANGLLTELVADDGPTPQLAPFPDGGVQIEWLVGGTSLVVDVDADGDVLITADEPSGDELFSIEFPFWNPDPVGLDLCRRLLEKMSGMVERRLGA